MALEVNAATLQYVSSDIKESSNNCSDFFLQLRIED